MKIKTIQLYICEYCDKKLFKAGSMKNHENLCSKNPANIGKCLSCEHLHKRDDGFSKGFFCGHPAKDSQGYPNMHTLVAEKKGLPKRYPEQFNESTLMPFECNLHENKNQEEFPFA